VERGGHWTKSEWVVKARLDAGGLYHFCSLEYSQIPRREITKIDNILDLTYLWVKS
jgi:hypothetical protein